MYLKYVTICFNWRIVKKSFSRFLIIQPLISLSCILFSKSTIDKDTSLHIYLPFRFNDYLPVKYSKVIIRNQSLHYWKLKPFTYFNLTKTATTSQKTWIQHGRYCESAFHEAMKRPTS